MSRATTRRIAAALLLAAVGACSDRQGANSRATIRLSPDAASASGIDAARLVDRDTTAPVRITTKTAVTLHFQHSVEVRRVKVHGARSIGVGIQGLSLGAEDAAGWAFGTLSTRITTRELTFTLEPQGSDAQLDELEVWGAGEDVETRSVQAVAEATRAEDAPERENLWVLRANPGAASLQPGMNDTACLRAQLPAADPHQARRAYLAFEADLPRGVALQYSFDGAAPTNGFWVGTTSGSRTLVQEIDPERLRGGDALLLCLPELADGAVSLHAVRLLLFLDDGREAFDRRTAPMLRAALDGDDATVAPVYAGTQVIELERPRDIESAELKLAHVPARLVSLARKDGPTWVEQGELELSAKAAQLPVTGPASAVRVNFAGAARADVAVASLSELALTGSGVGPRTGAYRIVLTYPETRLRDDDEVGERFGPKAYLSGWAESPAGRGTVEIDGARVDVDGAFSQALRRPLDATGSWPVTLHAHFPDGTELSRTVYLDDDREGELVGQASAAVSSGDARFGKENETRYGTFDPSVGGTVALGTDVYVSAPPGAVGGRTSIGIARKGHEVMPHLDPGMINVTAPAHGAYRFLPKGQKFARPVKVVLPYDPDLLPDGMLPEEVQTYYFDEAQDRWQTLPRREVRRDTKQVVSETTHFTFMINAVMVLPDHPGPASFNPNSIKDLKAADPSAGIDLVEPPQGNNQGTARLGFPIRLPKARGAYQPSLALSYDSANGNGWVGVGWDVAVSKIQIDGRYGVPEYLGEERYLLDGEAIVPVDESTGGSTCVDGATAGRAYRARVERDFRRILRCGTDPTRFWFEVTDKAGTLFVYGYGANARLTSYVPRVVSPPVFPPIYDVAEWYLERVVDANGNLTQFAYQHDSPTEPDAVHREPFRQGYLRSIQYSGTASRRDGGALSGGTAGVYLVELHHETAPRSDEVISARSGFKTLLRRRLGAVEIRLLAGTPSGLVRRYVLSYRRGDMGKSLLEKVTALGADESVFYAHSFEYAQKAPDADGVALFGAPLPWQMAAKDYGLSGSNEWGFGFHGFVGIGLSPYKGGGTVGVGFGYGRRQSETLVSMVDLNGDGLPDRAYRSPLPGLVPDIVLFNQGYSDERGAALAMNPPEWDPGHGGSWHFGLDGHRLGKDAGNSFDVSVQAFYLAGAVNAGASYTTASSSDFVIDANGDGLPDIVNGGQVYFNQPRSSISCDGQSRDKCCPAGEFCFLQSMPMEALQDLGDSSELLAADPTIAQANRDMDEALTPEDAVLEWTAPYGGDVDLSGQLAFVNPVASGDRRDGVRLRIYRFHPYPLTSDADLLATYVKTPGDDEETSVELGKIPVAPGTMLYFVLSTLSDFPMHGSDGQVSPVELVRFAPVITYVGTPGAARAQVGPNGAPVYRFDAAEDFLLQGEPQGAVNVPRTGTIDLTLELRKVATSDDVRVCVQYQDPPPESGSPPPRPGPCSSANGNVFYQVYGWSQRLDPAQQVPVTASVKAGGTLYFRVDTDVAIDPRAVTLNVAGAYTCVADDKGTCSAPDEREQKALSFRALPYMPLHDESVTLAPGAKVWQPAGYPLNAFRPNRPGTVSVWSTAQNAYRSGNPIVFTVRTRDQLLYKAVGNHTSGWTWTHVNAGDPVFIEGHSESARSFDPVRPFLGLPVPLQWTVSCLFLPDGGDPLRDMQSCNGYNQLTSDGRADSWDDGNQPVLAGGFHGWRHGAWNGKDGEEFTPWVFRGPTKAEASVSADIDVAVGDMQQDDPSRHSHRTRLRLGGLLIPSSTGTVLRNAGDGFEKIGDAFVSQDGNVYFMQGRMHAGKKGESASVQDKDPEGVTVRPLKFAIGKIGRSSTSVSYSLGASVAWASVALSRGESKQKLDVLDLNGDGIVDVVVGGNGSSDVRLTSPVSLATHRTLKMSGSPQITQEVSGQVGLGVSPTIQKLTVLGETRANISRSVGPGGGLAFSTGSVVEQLLDVNGDGLPDQVHRSTGGCPSGVAVHLNMGTSFAAGEDCLVLGADADPADALLAAAGGGSAAAALRRSTTVTLQGSIGAAEFTEIGKLSGGIDKTESWGASISGETSLTATNLALVDVTGDGLPDYVYKSNSGDAFIVRVNTGYGFAPARVWSAAPWLGDIHLPRHHLGRIQTALLDKFAGEGGISPLEATGSHSVLPSVGFSFDFSFPLFIVEPWMHIGAGANVSPKKVSGFELGLQDIDGDGLPDQVLKTSENGPVWARLNQLGRANLLTRVVRPLGGSIELAYDQRVGNTVEMPQSRWVLTKVVAHDGQGTGAGHDLETDWSYEHGRQERYEREFLGFEKVTRKNHGDGTTVEQVFDNQTVLTKGLLLVERLKSGGEGKKVLVETVNTWGDPIQMAGPTDACMAETPVIRLNPTTYCASFFTKLDAVEKRFYEGQATPGVVTRQEFAYNTNGDVGGFRDYGDLADPQDDLAASIAYWADDAAATEFHSLSRPKSVQIRDLGGQLLRARTAEYDANGNLTKLVADLGQGRVAQTDLHWNSNGTLDWVEGPANERAQRYKTSYGYDPVALTFVAAIVDSHGYTSTAEYDARFGEATATTDVNGKVTARKLDAYGRLERLAGPSDTLDAPTVAVTYAHTADVPYAWTRNKLPRASGDLRGAVDTVIAMDGLGRVLQTKKTAEIATSSTTKGVGWSVTGHQVFDAMGRVAAQGQTFASFNSRPEYVPGTPKNPTQFAYDELGRMVQTLEPNGSVTRVEYGFGTAAGALARRFKTTTTDAEGKSKAAYKDAADRVVAVEERIEGRTPTTHYQYNPVGDLLKVVDAAGNVTQLGYDLLGRRTRLKNFDTGEIRFDLDAAGNVVRKYDANLDAAVASIHYVYDFDQLVRIEYPDASRNVTYTYGTAATAADRNGIGRVIEVTDDAGKEQRSYGALGELTSSTRTIRPMAPYFREQSFTTSFSYDSFGRMMGLAYPDGETVTYRYDAGGLLESATGHRPSGSAVPGDEVYLASMTYDEFGQRVRMTLGNGVVSSYAYDPLTRRLGTLTTTTPLGRTLQAITYGYDRVGNVKTMVNALGEPVGDQSGAVSFQYGYDDLYRLTFAYGEAKSRAHTIDSYTASYGYSDIHNMRSNVQIHQIVHGGDTLSAERPPKTNHVFAYDYDPAAPHRARKIGDTFLVYDGNGNTVRECRDTAGDPSCGAQADHRRTYTWSAENRLDHVVEGGGRNITRFIYDGAGDRVVKLGRGGESITVGQFWSLKGRRAATKHVFAGSTRLASKLLPPPGWDPAGTASVVTAVVAFTSGTTGTLTTTTTNVNGCEPSNYQPQKCPVLPGGDPSINHQYDDTRVRPETYYYHQDHLGSTSWVTDQHAKVHEHVEYFPYGEVWRDPRSDADGAPVKGQRFLFTSKEMDEETGLYYFGARYYDPLRVRWASVDPAFVDRVHEAPAPRGLAPYLFSGHSPIVMRDPDGRECVLVQGRGVQCDEHYARASATLRTMKDAAWNQGRYGEALADETMLAFDSFGRMGAAIEQVFADAVINPAGMWVEGMLTGNEREASDGAFQLFVGMYAGWEAKFAYGAGTYVPNASRAGVPRGLGNSIANGHSFEKHVVKAGEYQSLGIKTRQQFAKLVEDVVARAKGSDIRKLSRGRTAFWDDQTATVVIHDPASTDWGTAFRPKNGRKYFEGLE